MENFFEQGNEKIVVPPFLVPDATFLWRLFARPDTLNPETDMARIEAEAGAVMDRHIERMAAQDVAIKKAQKLSPLIADSTVGLVFDQAAAQRSALAGRYAQDYFGEQLPALREQYPVVFALISSQPNPGETVHSPASLPFEHPVSLIFAAWQFHRQVVIERRPMSMVPIVGGDSQGDTPSFTPVLQRIGDHEWQLGRPGDTAPVSPKVFKGEIGDLFSNITAAYSDWYHRDQDWLQRSLNEQSEKIPDHLYIPAWARRLQLEHSLHFGDEVELTNVSHGRLYRLAHRGMSQLFRTTAPQAVKLALVAAAGEHPSAPDPAAIEEAYLNLIAKRGESVSLEAIPAEKGDTAPLGETPVSAVFAVKINGQTKVRVAWLKGHPKALGVVSGVEQPARAVLLLSQNPARLGLAPFSFKTRQPDLSDIWSASPVEELNVADESVRRAISAWAGWVWEDRSTLKKYQPGGKK